MMKFKFWKKEKEPEEKPDPPDHISAAYSATFIFSEIHSCSDHMDQGLLSKEDQRRIKAIKRMSLRIAHAHLEAEYESLFGKDDDD